MNWCLGLDGRAFDDVGNDKLAVLRHGPPHTDEGWGAIAALALEITG
jgi:hypothetical protein